MCMTVLALHIHSCMHNCTNMIVQFFVFVVYTVFIMICSLLDSGLALGAGLDNSNMNFDKKPPAKALKITPTLGSKPGNTVKSNFPWGALCLY